MPPPDQILALPPLPPRPIDGHKGTFGRVLVVGGSEDMLGAPVLAGAAALRMGCGLAQIAVPRSILPAALSAVPELVGLGLPKTGGKKELADAAAKADAIVVGPGLGQQPAAAARLMQLIALTKPLVVDADALNLLAQHRTWPRTFRAPAILTPHPGEMQRLAKLLGRSDVPSDQPGRIDIATRAAQTFGQIVILKGHRTIVTDGRRYYINTTGDSTLAKAGSGDLLSGMIASLLAQNMPPFEAAILATHLHGLAGQLAGQRLNPRSALARDILDSLPQALATLDLR